MYEAFYGLRERPFNLTPDPKFLYLSDKHKEAFAHLLFGIRNRSGFVMITGEIGTGKTTICRNLLNQLEDDTEVAFIFNPALSPVELMRKICSEFGLKTQADNTLDLVDALNAYLLRAAASGKNCVLVIDEAQNLAPQVLEQIRLLSNLETETEKLLQIVLIGQPELAEKLALHELRQLNQRITARYHLRALSERETLQYIAYRIHVAGGRGKVTFSKGAVRTVFKRSGGTPRVINAICDRALLIGYTKEARTITGAIVKQAAGEIRGHRVKTQRRQREAVWRGLIPNQTLLVTAALVLLVVWNFAGPFERVARELGTFNALFTGTTDGGNTAIAKVEPAAVTASAPLESAPVAQKVFEKIRAMDPDAREREAFEGMLAGLDPAVARNAAAAALLQAWNIGLTSDFPQSDEAASLAEFAGRNGLDSEVLSPALDQLAALGLPAFVRVRQEGKQCWLGLLGAEGDTLRLSTTLNETVEAPRAVFAERYAGEAVVLWRDPAPGAPALLPGRKDGLVAELKQSLRGLGRLSPTNTDGSYDARTASAIAKIQSETGLLVDGIAGRQVRMVLSSWIPNSSAPSLRAGGGPPPVPAAPEPMPRAGLVKRDAPRLTAAPAPVSVPEPAPLPDASVVFGPVTPAPEAPAPDAAPEPAGEPGSPEAAPAAPEPPEALLPDADASGEATARVEVRDLAKPAETETLPPLNTDALKETTAPADAILPLIPSGTDRG